MVDNAQQLTPPLARRCDRYPWATTPCLRAESVTRAIYRIQEAFRHLQVFTQSLDLLRITRRGYFGPEVLIEPIKRQDCELRAGATGKPRFVAIQNIMRYFGMQWCRDVFKPLESFTRFEFLNNRFGQKLMASRQESLIVQRRRANKTMERRNIC